VSTSGVDAAYAGDMITRSRSRRLAIVVAAVLPLPGCGPVTLRVSPERVLATVIANMPSTASSDGRATSRGRRIPESAPPSPVASQVLRTADEYVGTPYRWGGNTPSEGFDCSGFTKFVFAKYGITLPRTSRDQARAGTAVSANLRALHPGDLMLFAEPGEAISHVAIYAGNGRIIHASSSSGGVRYTDLNDGGDWFVANFVAARRVL
jgi:cell wall-associated NlpC family hydrolase